MSLYDFKLLVSDYLRMQNKPICLKKVGRPAINIDLRHSQKKRRGRNTRKIPAKSIREDKVGHFPIDVSVRRGCKNPGCKSKPITFCLKCKVFLCSTTAKRCFLEFHGVDFDPADLPQ